MLYETLTFSDGTPPLKIPVIRAAWQTDDKGDGRLLTTHAEVLQLFDDTPKDFFYITSSKVKYDADNNGYLLIADGDKEKTPTVNSETKYLLSNGNLLYFPSNEDISVTKIPEGSSVTIQNVSNAKWPNVCIIYCSASNGDIVKVIHRIAFNHSFVNYLSVLPWILASRQDVPQYKITPGAMTNNKVTQWPTTQIIPPLSFTGGEYPTIYFFDGDAPHSTGQELIASLNNAGYGDDIEKYNVLFEGNIPVPPTPPSSDNPYTPGGTSGIGGGNGTFDRTSDPIPFTDLPTLTSARAGMISLFNPSLSELQSLSARLWSKDFLDAFVNYFTDPSEIIISLGIVPVTPPISGRSDLQAGLISTGIEMNTVSSQFMSFNLGSMDVLPFYDAALDYAPFTKISVFLPYIGVRQLNTDEVMNNKVEIQYNIDLFSGACVAEIKVGESVLYSFNGNILSSVPVSARSFDSLISAVINGATAIGGAIATGGATAGLAISTTVNAVQASKPEILRSGNASANIGLLAGQRAYLIFEIPNQSMPENNQTFVGFPSNITSKLGDLTGFTQVDTIHLENIPATNNEITEIENLLRQGVIL